MGLDLAIVLARKGKKPVWDDYTQLAYGRKAWELCYELGGGSKPSEWFKLDTETWDRVIEKIAPIADKLPEIREAYHKYVWGRRNLTLDEEELVQEYEDWYDNTWDEEPQLGYDFSVGYMQNFWDARMTVAAYLASSDHDVYVMVSY